jgi:hypothetical protein
VNANAALRNFYYDLKPFIPERGRAAMRRLQARRLRRRHADTWPIDQTTARRPHGWQGWPGGKQFAFVLTHDVEGRTGLAQCERVAELEIDRGFRSSFNFVPEGEYRVPESLRAFLGERGFEVGVHDLHHDGKLYRSRDKFQQSAAKINDYLRSWGAVGFRSAFMLHNLDWLKDLDVRYDASTFDTDPFEPQPDGAATIFPFWIARNLVDGYVELPYTLAQDSTLFNVLKEPTIGVWTAKLDWLASQGGMALVNVHPDYMRFDRPSGGPQYSASLYEQFLEYVSRRYAREAWFALPREVATYVRGLNAASAIAV